MLKYIFPLATIFMIMSCQVSNKRLIINKWKLVNTSLPITDSAKNELYKNFLMQFTSDNKYLLGFNDLKEVGVYKLSKDQLAIIITDNNSADNDEVEILKLTSDTLKTKSKSKGFESVFVAIK
jgi:hypothetical protein